MKTCNENAGTATTIAFKLEQKNPPATHATAATHKISHDDVSNALNKRWRENEKIRSFFKAQESFDVKTAQDFLFCANLL